MFHLRRNQVVDLQKQNWKLSQREVLSKDAGPFLDISWCFSHISAIANQLPGFSISRGLEDFFK